MHMLGRRPTNHHILYYPNYAEGFYIADVPDWHYHYGDEEARVKVLTAF